MKNKYFYTMNTNKKEIQTKIESEIFKTTENIKQLKEFTKPIEPDCAIGRVSRMDAINNKAINENALQKAEQKLNALKIALKRIDEPDFGKCARCKNEIPLGRILLMPQSRFCVYCASK